MENENQLLNKVFEVLALNFERLNEFDRFLKYKVNKVKKASSGIDLRNYENGWRFERWTEAELITDIVICWWFELRYYDNLWKIEYDIHVAQGDYIKDFETRHADNWKDLLKEIDLAISDLIVDHQFIDNYA